MAAHKRAIYTSALALVLVGVFGYLNFALSGEYHSGEGDRFVPLPELDKADYDARLLALAHASTTVATSTQARQALAGQADPFATTTQLWPAPAPYPNAGAILPFKRIVAYYGNFFSRQMGVLGEYPPDEMLAMLASTTAMWQRADPSTPTLPAIQYIAVVAQNAPGKEGNYILRMPDEEIERAYALAMRVHGILILDVQVGKSTLERELPLLEKYLRLPQVHLAIDPEFSMKRGGAPGTVIGTYDASDINYAAEYLAGLARQYYLPPKVLVVHRFTQLMVTNYQEITPLPEVQIVMDMDGWGPPEKKEGTYNAVIAPEPVQFTGLKLFYHADLKPPSTRLLTPEEILALTPAPIYIQYQ